MIYLRVLGAMAVAVTLKAAAYALYPTELLHAEVHGIGAYLAVVGGLYSITVAFLIYVVWGQFNQVQSGLTYEASALEDLCRVAGFLSERASTRRIRETASQYLKSTSGDEPHRLAVGEVSHLAEQHFGDLCQTIRGAEVKTEKDGVIYGELLHGLRRVLDMREQRLSVSATRVPGTLWHLILFASIVLFGGFLALGLRSFGLSLAVVAAVAGTIVFLLSVIRDMDNPFRGIWNVSYAPMKTIATRIERM
jgi:hypothetical protein